MISFNQLGNLGRLGNQMFQYASLKGIAANRGFDFCIPPNSVFGVSDQNVKDFNLSIHSAFSLNGCYIGLMNNKIVMESGFGFDEKFFNTCEDNVDIFGYFQSEKYFSHIKDEIKKDFTFNVNTYNFCKSIIDNEIMSNDVISLHIRRDDYLYLNEFHPVLSIEYYNESLKKMPDLPVIIFSDDIEWVSTQDLFSSDRFFISQSNCAEDDMCLMSMCNYHIIANSSFSWWGAWLANSKKVIAPKNWFGFSLCDNDTSDLYCDEWEVL